MKHETGRKTQRELEEEYWKLRDKQPMRAGLRAWLSHQKRIVEWHWENHPRFPGQGQHAVQSAQRRVAEAEEWEQNFLSRVYCLEGCLDTRTNRAGREYQLYSVLHQGINDRVYDRFSLTMGRYPVVTVTFWVGPYEILWPWPKIERALDHTKKGEGSWISTQ